MLKRIAALLVWLSVAVAGSIALADNMAPGLVPGPADDSAQRLMAGDRLMVKVFEEEQISGTYLIDASGVITLPIVGSIKISGLTLEASQKAIEAVLSQGYYTKPVVSVRVDEYRPIYVHGYVKSPGVYPFRTGLTAIGAIVVAGGAPNALTTALMATSDLVTAEERVTVQTARRSELWVRIAALEALRDDRADIDVESLPPEVKDTRGLDELVKNEKKQMQSDRLALENEIDVLQRQQPQFDLERKTIDNEIEAQQKLLVLFQQRADQLDKLAKKGLSRNASLIEPAQQLAMTESSISRLRSSRSRNDIERTALELKIIEKRNTLRQRVMLQLNDLKRALTDNTIQLQSAIRIRALRRQAAGYGDRPGSPQTFIIVRVVDGEQKTIQGTAAMAIQPGDIVEVRNFDENISADTGDAGVFPTGNQSPASTPGRGPTFGNSGDSTPGYDPFQPKKG